ncbi:MAG: four helix bundle protein [Calditrichaeota bacterium]|nr:four helix bundle protein [Calditrichota bacterium]
MFKKLEDMEVWKRGCRLAVDIYRLTYNEPLTKDWGLRDQIRRAAVSIPSNIAEGYERNSQKEFKRFLFIAKGSCGELRTQLYIIKKLGLLTFDEIDPLIKECIEISSMLQSLASHIISHQDK